MKSSKRSIPGSAISADGISPLPADCDDGLLSLRRREERGSMRLRDLVMSGRRGGDSLRDRARDSLGDLPNTPLSSSPSGVPPPFDAAE